MEDPCQNWIISWKALAIWFSEYLNTGPQTMTKTFFLNFEILSDW